MFPPPKLKPVPDEGTDDPNENDPAVEGRGGSIVELDALFWPNEKVLVAGRPKSPPPNGLFSAGAGAANGLELDEAPNEKGAGACGAGP